MEREPAIEIEAAIRLARCRDGKDWPHLVIPWLEEGNDDVQAVSGAALKDGDENLAAGLRVRGGAKQPRWRSAQCADGDCRGAEKRASGQQGYLR